jgi:hypothetical protein
MELVNVVKISRFGLVVVRLVVVVVRLVVVVVRLLVVVVRLLLCFSWGELSPSAAMRMTVSLCQCVTPQRSTQATQSCVASLPCAEVCLQQRTEVCLLCDLGNVVQQRLLRIRASWNGARSQRSDRSGSRGGFGCVCVCCCLRQAADQHQKQLQSDGGHGEGNNGEKKPLRENHFAFAAGACAVMGGVSGQRRLEPSS